MRKDTEGLEINTVKIKHFYVAVPNSWQHNNERQGKNS